MKIEMSAQTAAVRAATVAQAAGLIAADGIDSLRAIEFGIAMAQGVAEDRAMMTAEEAEKMAVVTADFVSLVAGVVACIFGAQGADPDACLQVSADIISTFNMFV